MLLVEILVRESCSGGDVASAEADQADDHQYQPDRHGDQDLGPTCFPGVCVTW